MLLTKIKKLLINWSQNLNQMVKSYSQNVSLVREDKRCESGIVVETNEVKDKVWVFVGYVSILRFSFNSYSLNITL